MRAGAATRTLRACILADVRLRAGVVRALLAVVAMALLVLPVGAEREGGVRILSVPDALLELAQGRIGVGILSAIVTGGPLARAALVRVSLSALLWIGFAVAGLAVAKRPIAVTRHPRRRCHACGFVTATTMPDCPACGERLRA